MSKVYVLPKNRLRRSDIKKIQRVCGACKVLDAKILMIAYGSLTSEKTVEVTRKMAASLHEDVDALMDIVTSRGDVEEAGK